MAVHEAAELKRDKVKFPIMMRTLLTPFRALCCLTFAQQNSGAGGAQNKATARAKIVRYLRPDAFKAVPARVRSKLNEGQCLIPQDAENAAPHNIVQRRVRSARATGLGGLLLGSREVESNGDLGRAFTVQRKPI